LEKAEEAPPPRPDPMSPAAVEMLDLERDEPYILLTYWSWEEEPEEGPPPDMMSSYEAGLPAAAPKPLDEP